MVYPADGGEFFLPISGGRSFARRLHIFVAKAMERIGNGGLHWDYLAKNAKLDEQEKLNNCTG